MMSRLKKFRWTFLAAALSLAATTTADNLKYDKLDWDDDLVPNAQKLSDGTSSLDPLQASSAASRALVLGTVKDAGGVPDTDYDDDGLSDNDEEFGTTPSGKNDPLSPLVWRALKGDGTDASTLAIRETDRSLGVNATDPKLSQDWTLECWFNPDSDNGTGSLISRTSAKGIYFDLGLKGGVPYVRASMTGPWTENGNPPKVFELVSRNGGKLVRNAWTHLAATWDAQSKCLSLYLNGVFAGSKFCVAASIIDGAKPGTSFTTQILGPREDERDDKQYYYLKGYIDEVRVWTDTAEGHIGKRLQKQIRQWMSKAPAVLLDVPSDVPSDDYANIPTAYYRFDDGGDTAQDFAYPVSREIADGQPHALKATEPTDSLAARLVSSWDGADDLTGANWKNARPGRRAVNMNGGGNAEYDPIPDGWQQLYWGETAGGAYDFNQTFIFSNNKEQQNVPNKPLSFPGENSSLIDPETGVGVGQNNWHNGKPNDPYKSGERNAAYVYFTDLFFDDVTSVKNVELYFNLNSLAEDKDKLKGINTVLVFVNGKRKSFTPGGSGDAGSDITNDVAANAIFSLSQKDPISKTINLRQYMVNGRNRVTIFVNHTNYNTDCKNHDNHNYSFCARIRVDGKLPYNTGEHVKWFYAQQSSFGENAGLGLGIVSPSQEKAANAHIKEADGVTDYLCYWWEKDFAIQPWAYDQDPDGDGLTNWNEFLANTNPLSRVNTEDLVMDGDHDADADGLNNINEQNLKTFPHVADTDDDGVSDYDEINNGSDPLDSTSCNRKNAEGDIIDQTNKALSLDGSYTIALNEVGDVVGQNELKSWTVEAWVKPKFAARRQIIVRRTVGRYTQGDAVNYELGLTEKGLPYAGFTVVKDNVRDDGTVDAAHPLVMPIYAEMTLADGNSSKWSDDTWYHLAATFLAPEGTRAGTLVIYVNGSAVFTRDNIADMPPYTMRGVGGLTLGSALPKDGKPVGDDPFVGRIDNLAIWSESRTATNIRESYNSGLKTFLQGSTYTFNNLKVAIPFVMANPALLHAYLFDDGGTTVENYAWKQDWYNGFAHAFSAPGGRIVEDNDRSDSDSVDADNNGLPDNWERKHFGDIGQDPAADPDGDGLTNLYEYLAGTNPNKKETVTGVNDGTADPDGDGLTNLFEQKWGTHPRKADSDDDGVPDGEELHGLLVDGQNVPTLVTHPMFSMAHYDRNLIDTEIDGGHVKLTPNRSLDLSVPAKAKSTDKAGWTGLELPQNIRFDNLANGATFETWIKLPAEALATDGDYKVIAAKCGADLNVLALGYTVKGGRAYVFGIFDAIDTVGGGTREVRVGGSDIATAEIRQDTWTHIALVWQPTSSRFALVLDGVIDITLATNHIPYVKSNQSINVYLGGDGYFNAAPGAVNDEMTAGYLDETRIWNTVRDTAAIRSAKDDIISGSESGLLAYFRYDDGGLAIEDFTHPYGDCHLTNNADQFELKAADYLVADALVESNADGSDTIQTSAGADGHADWTTAIDACRIGGLDDTDHDGLPDWWEATFNTTDHYNVESFVTTADPDGDGLSNLYEYYCRTNPNVADTDGNGVSDANEDFDGDGLTNAEEDRYSSNPQLKDSDDDGFGDKAEIDAGCSPSHPSSRPDFLRSSLDVAKLVAEQGNSDGAILPHPERFIFGDGDWTVEAWFKKGTDLDGDIFAFNSYSGDSLALGLKGGYPFGRVYRDGAASNIIEVGGPKTAPDWKMPELNDGWNHLALVWIKEAHSLRLLVNGVSLSATFTQAEPVIGAGIATLARNLDDGFIDEFRVWNESRSVEAIERWMNDIIPTFASINRQFNDAPFTTGSSDDAILRPYDNPGDIYRFSTLLLAYYRFDDKGTYAEDYVNLFDRDYFLDIRNAFAETEFANLDGVDDEDGDSIPEWWIDLHGLNHWRQMDATGSKGTDTLQLIAHNIHGVDGRNTLGWSGTVEDSAPATNTPAATAGPQPLATVGHMIRDFTVYSSIGSISPVGVRTSSTEGDKTIANGSSILFPSGIYTSLWKYIVLDRVPNQAIFHAYITNGALTQLVINGRTVAGAANTDIDVAPYLQRGRNLIYLYLTSDQGTYTISGMSRPGYWTHSTGGNKPVISQQPWPAISVTVPTALMKADFQLLVDGNKVICRGDEYTYDPRSVWHGRTATTAANARPSDLDDRIWSSLNYGIHNDPEASQPGSEEFAVGDGLTNLFEYMVNTNPKDSDSDNNGIPDALEDFDGDGLPNGLEDTNGTDPTLADTDDDGLSDSEEIAQGYDPTDGNSPAIQRCVAFNGAADAYLLYPAQNRFALNDWTLEMWVKPNTMPAERAVLLERTVGVYAESDTVSRKLINYGIGFEPDAKVSVYFTDIQGKEFSITSLNAISVDGATWTHIAASYDSASRAVTLWINGEESRRMNATVTPVTSGAGFVELVSGKGFNGCLDEVRFWNDVRTEAEINAWKAVTLKVKGNEDIIADLGDDEPFANLIAYYRFDDGGKTAQDSIDASYGDWKNSWRNAATFVNVAGASYPQFEEVTSDSPIESDNLDTDGDGMPDFWEEKYGLDPNDPADADLDADGDGLTNLYEYLAGTDPTNKYSIDVADIFGNAKPKDLLDADWDADCDGLTNLDEQSQNTHPRKPDSDDDGILDGVEYADYTSPLHSMNKKVGDRNYVNRYLVLANIGDASKSGIVIPVTATEAGQSMASWTVEAWVRAATPAEASGSIVKRVIGLRTGFELGLVNGIPYVRYNTSRGTEQALTAPVALNANEWTHLAAVWNPAIRTLMLVINGNSAVKREFAANDLDYLPADGTSVFTMAAPASDGWKGGIVIDEVRIWTTNRTMAQLDDARRELVQAGTPNLFRDFRFDDGGLTIEDFAHPGWRNAEFYAIPAARYNVPVTGIGDIDAATYGAIAAVWNGQDSAKRDQLVGNASWFGTDDDALEFYGLDDSNGNGMPDWFENVYGLTDANGDEDGDGLTNLYEYLAGTNPIDNLSGTADYYAKAIHADGTEDRLTNAQKQQFGLDPRLADSDGDGLEDYDEIFGTAETFRQPSEDTYAANPLNPLSNVRPQLQHIQFNGTALTVPAQGRHAVESWTLMASVKPSSTAAAKLFFRQVSDKGITFEFGWQEGGKLYARLVSDKGEEFAVPQGGSSDKLTVKADVWQHVAASYDAETATMTLYLDGMPVAQNVLKDARIDCPAYGDGVIGGTFAGPQFTIGDDFVGQADNIRLYGQALSASQIFRDHRSSLSSDSGAAAPYGTSEGGYLSNTQTVNQMLSQEHQSGQFIVKFKDHVDSDSIGLVAELAGFRVLRKLDFIGAYLMETVNGTSDNELYYAMEDARYYMALANIEYLQPNYRMSLMAAPDDTYYGEQWGLENTGQTTADDTGWPAITGIPGCDAHVRALWDKGITGTRDVVVAVIDTGVDYSHPDLAANIWTNTREIPGNGIDDDGNGYVDDVHGYDFGSLDGDPMDDSAEAGHGTHCAGNVGAVGNNGAGVSGVNWNVSIMCVKIASDSGVLSADCAAAVGYAVSNGASISSNSWGGYYYDDALYDACRKALSAGHLLVCAAGNESNDNDGPYSSYPASYDLDNIISVAATTPQDNLTSFSCYGATSVDVAAPGYGILSTYPNGTYFSCSGTSMATPITAGVVALLKSQFPTATMMDLKEALIAGSDPVAALNGKVVANGRINAENSYSHLASRTMLLCLRGNGLAKGKLLDLTRSELGASAAGRNGGAPAVERYALDASASDVSAATANAAELAAFAGDSDGDGIPDWLEIALGLDPATTDGDQDPDGDGLTNYFESLAGTSPWDAITDSQTLDSDIVNPMLNTTYAFVQKRGYHPLTTAETDRDDDGVKGVLDSAENNPLVPYTSRVLKLEDTGYAELPNQPRLALEGSWTLEAWVRMKMSKDDKTGDTRVVVRRDLDTTLDGTYNAVNYELGVICKAKGCWVPYVSFTMARGAEVTSTAMRIESTTVLNDNEWTHIAGSYSQENSWLLVAVNNKDFRQKTVTGVVPVAAQPGLSRVRIGAEESGMGFVGEVDAVKVWSIARETFDDYLTASTATLPATPTLSLGLVALYLFDDGGHTAQDFASALDDWNTGWANAATIVAPAVMDESDSPVTPSDVDSDGDGIPDWWELLYGLDPNDPSDATADLDGDGLNNLYEYLSGTYPDVKDSDGDGLTDDKEDCDGDGLTNFEEQGWSTRPDLADTDDDGINDRVEVMVGSSPNHPASIATDANGIRLDAKWFEGKDMPADITDAFGWAKDNLGDLAIETWRFTEAQPRALDLTSLDAVISLPKPDRFAVGKVPETSGNFVSSISTSGQFTVEFWVRWNGVLWYDKNDENDKKTEQWIFASTGSTGYGMRLGLDAEGAPRGEIVRDGDTVTFAGGSAKTPVLEKDVWTHLALVWNPGSRTLQLYRDGIAVIGSSLVANANDIDFGDTASTAVINKVAGVMIDEFRFWTVARTAEQIEYWANRIVPAPFSDVVAGEHIRVSYPLKAYYRFDDMGSKVEDFAHFRDEDYMLPANVVAATTADNAKALFGVDDVDGDSIPEWWVQLHRLDAFVTRRNVNRSGVATGRDDYARRAVVSKTTSTNNNNNTGTTTTTTYKHEGQYGRQSRRGPLPLGDVWGFTGLEVIGTFVPNNMPLGLDYQFVELRKDIVLDKAPETAALTLYDPGKNCTVSNITVISPERISTIAVPAFDGTTYEGTVDIASALSAGRNAIYIAYTRRANGTESIVYPTEDGNQTLAMQRYFGVIDVKLVADEYNDLIVYGQDNPYDPRAIWMYNALTDLVYKEYTSGITTQFVDKNGFLMDFRDYAMVYDADDDGLDVYWEYQLGYNPNAANSKGIDEASADYDGDGLANLFEITNGMSPKLKDTDNDGLSDSDEWKLSSDALDGNDPIANRSVLFDGKEGNFVELPMQSRFALTAWTIEAWIKPTKANQTGTIIRRTVGTVNPDKPLVNYTVELKDGNVHVAFSSQSGSFSHTITGATFKPAVGEWTHVAMTYNGAAEVAVYVNGLKAAGVNANVQPLAIGPGLVSARIGEGFVGQVDEVRFWSTVRTADEIEAARKTTLDGSETGLVAYYRFDDVNFKGREAIVGEDSAYYRTAADAISASAHDWLNGWRNAAVFRGVLSDSKYTVVDDGSSSPLEADADTNNNLIPDRWERKYFGGNLLFNGIDETTGEWRNDALLDQVTIDGVTYGDSDELNFLYEYLSGTNPNIDMTDGLTWDSEADADLDGIPNLEEQYLGTRPDDRDTDDDGYSDALEEGYDYYKESPTGPVLTPGFGSFASSAVSSLQQPRALPTAEPAEPGSASLADIARVFRMDGTNAMIARDVPGQSGNTLSVAFWFRFGVKLDDGKLAGDDALLPNDMKAATFLRRTVTAQKGACNYKFSFDGTNLIFWVGRKSASATGNSSGFQVSYRPTDGFKANNWYFIAGVIELEETTPQIRVIGISGRPDGNGSYTYDRMTEAKSGKLTIAQGSNVGDDGQLILGIADGDDPWPAGLVLDVDNLCIWNNLKTSSDFRTMLNQNTIGYGEFANALISQYLFDDGGRTAQDFATHDYASGVTPAPALIEDWWNDWRRAGILTKATVEASESDPVGRGMIRDSSLADFDADKDKDGLPDDWEIFFLGSLEYGANDDPDGDGLTNSQEYSLSATFRDSSLGSNPAYDVPGAWLNPNDPDTDGDSMDDGFEASYPAILNPLNPNDRDEDPDEDGLVNWQEALYATDPSNEDTDGDGLPDGWEVTYTRKDAGGNVVDPSLDPLNPDGAYGADGDPDNDGYTNYEEYVNGTNPLQLDSPDADTDGDGIKDVDERQNGVNTDTSKTDTDDDEFDDYTELTTGTKGFNSLSKTAISRANDAGFVYKGNLAGHIRPDHGTMTVPAAGNPNRLGFGSWTVEARFRLLNANIGDWYTKDHDVYLVRRAFAKNDYADNEPVTETEIAWNYAIGFRVKADDPQNVYPFISWKALNGAERRLESTVGLAITPNAGDASRGTSDWHFLTGVYNAGTQKLTMYLDGAAHDERTITNISNSAAQCPTDASKVGSGFQCYVKLGEGFGNGDSARQDSLLIDEVRVWGVQSNTVAADKTATGYVTNFVRSANEIAFGHSNPVTPVWGVYDPSLNDRFQTTTESGSPYKTNTITYMLDQHISDSDWATKPGTIGSAVRLSYHDQNANGRWDPGEDIWRDRSVAEAMQEEAGKSDYDPTSYEDVDSDEIMSNYFNETKDGVAIDCKIAYGTNGWVVGKGYTRATTSTGTNGTTTTTSTTVSAADSLVGRSLDAFYVDRNGNGVCDSEDDIWLEFDTENVTTWYQPEQQGWAVRQGLALYLRFDDGGASIEDFAWRADWRSSPAWKHAIRPTGLAGVWPPSDPKAIGGVDYQYATTEFADGFAWVIEAVQAPTAPVAVIRTYSDADNDAPEFAYVPVNFQTADAQLADFDVLTADITKQASDPEGATISYLHFWLLGKTFEADANGFATTLTYDDAYGCLLDNEIELANGIVVATGRELDLYNLRASLTAGAKVQLATVALSASGMASKVHLDDITVITGDDKLPEPVEFVRYSPTPAVDGQSFTLTLKVNESRAGKVHLRWYRNLTLFSEASKAVAGAGEVTFTMPGSNVIDGDVWAYKAYFAFENSDSRIESRSRTTPPEKAGQTGTVVSTENADWIFLPVGIGYDEETETSSNKAPTTPKTVIITPQDADVDSLLIANVSGSTDPDGDRFAYQYQWYIDGKAVIGETFPYFPAITEATTITDTDSDGTETSTSLSATSLAAGNVISVRVWATDIYGHSSNKLVSDSVVILESLQDLNSGNLGTHWAYESNDTPKQATRLLAKEDWSDVGDANAQEHYFHTYFDVDYFWFIVPDKLSENKTLVKFETNAGDIMYNSAHQFDLDVGLDTKLDLLKADGKTIIHTCDNYYSKPGTAATKYARFELELDPGLYYVRVYSAMTSTAFQLVSGNSYFVHLGLFDVKGAEGPTSPTTVSLTPLQPTSSQNLECSASGSVSSESIDEPEYYYVWYRNGVVVPFGKEPDVSAWNTARFELSYAKNFSADPKLAAQPHIVPAEYTQPGDIWHCVVYAKDVNGYSEPVTSNRIIVTGAVWNANLYVTKTYRSADIANVTGNDQAVVIGLDDNATFGFDPTFDSAAANGTTPDGKPLAMGSMYSVGMDNTYTKLNRDYRPYGRSASWYIKIEMGDASIDSCTLSWPNITLPTDAVGKLTITRMMQLTDRTWEVVDGTTQDMTAVSSISLDSSDITGLQKDDKGQYFIVFRITLGAADEGQDITLYKGWNMISMSVTPLNNAVSSVFTNAEGKKVVRGDVWRYENGQYVATSYVTAGVGYWVYASQDAIGSSAIRVYGNRPTDGIPLKKGWNMMGPIYTIPDFAAAYPDLKGIIDFNQIYKVRSTPQGVIDYVPATGMEIGSAYWIYCNEAVVLPVIPTAE